MTIGNYSTHIAAVEPELVQLQKLGPSPIASRRFSPSMVDKFFAAGALASFLGGAGIGAHLWLMQNGKMPVAWNYASLRSIHALVQTYLFLGLFILGFLLQSAPKVLKVKASARGISFMALPSLVVGILLFLHSPEGVTPRLFFAAPFFGTFLFIAFLTYRGREDLREIYSAWVLMGLLGLGMSPWFSVERPENAVVFLWSGVVPIVFAAGQQFLSAFLGGKRLGKWVNRLLFACYASALIFMLAARATENALLWHISGAFAFLTLLIYLSGTDAIKAASKLLVEPLAFAFVTGYFWALAAAAIIAWIGPSQLDSCFHLFVLGWLSTLIISVSSQVLRAISGTFLLSRRLVLILLIVWQLVPVGRGLRYLTQLPPGFSHAVLTAATIVLFPWVLAVFCSAAKIRRQERGRSAT